MAKFTITLEDIQNDKGTRGVRGNIVADPPEAAQLPFSQQTLAGQVATIVSTSPTTVAVAAPFLADAIESLQASGAIENYYGDTPEAVRESMASSPNGQGIQPLQGSSPGISQDSPITKAGLPVVTITINQIPCLVHEGTSNFRIGLESNPPVAEETDGSTLTRGHRLAMLVQNYPEAILASANYLQETQDTLVQGFLTNGTPACQVDVPENYMTHPSQADNPENTEVSGEDSEEDIYRQVFDEGVSHAG